MKNTKMTELEFTIKIKRFLSAQNYKVYPAYHAFEIPNLGQSMDIFAVKGKKFTAIEAKLSNWKCGLVQCKAHEMVCDYVCLAIATKSISERLRDEIRLRKYGLIHYRKETDECVWSENPILNESVWYPQRIKFYKMFKSLNLTI